MPQLPSGRPFGISCERLLDWAESAPFGRLSQVLLNLHAVEDFHVLIDLIEYADPDPDLRPAQPSPENPGGGQPFQSLVRIDELKTRACPWPEIDQAALVEWLRGSRLQQLFEHAQAELLRIRLHRVWCGNRACLMAVGPAAFTG
jgi:hypothetical protein